MQTLIKKIKLDKRQNKAIPLYQQIRQQVQSNIDKKDLGSGDTFPSITYLAKEWDVTYRTIKSAFELLEEDGVVTFRKGKCIVVANSDDRETKVPERAFTMSFITCRHDCPYYAVAYAGLRRFALENNIEYLMVDVGSSKKRFLEAISNTGDDVDGLLVLPIELPGFAEAVQKAIDSGKKVVFFDRTLPGVNASSVETDHFSTGFVATTHLLEQHDRPVYYFAIVDKPSGARNWYKGWSTAMQSHNYTDLKPYTFDLTVSEDKLAGTLDIGLEFCIEAATRFFQTHREDKYCIFSGNDFIARGIYIAAKNAGLQIGKDVFLVGSNNMPFAAKMEVPLSSVATIPSAEQLGYQAAKMLYEHLTGVIKNPVRKLIPVELIARQSSLALPGNSVKEAV